MNHRNLLFRSMHWRVIMVVTVLTLTAAVRPNGVAAVSLNPGQVSWIRVDPVQPNTLYIGVAGDLLKKSTDGGITWQYMPNGAKRGTYALVCQDSVSPPLISSGGHDLYTRFWMSIDPACRTGVTGWLQSRDGGLSYTALGSDTTFTLALPIQTARLYSVTASNGGDYLGYPECMNKIRSRGPTDSAWRVLGTVTTEIHANPLSIDQACFDLVADPAHLNTIFADTSPVRRSEDGGLTWSTVVTPTTTPPLTTFAVRYDPGANGLLEGFTRDPSVAPDHVFLSADAGRSWSEGPCPGEHLGKCPAIVLSNVFGAGAGTGYAVFPDGVYAFHNAGPAGAALALTAHWPFRLNQVADMQGAGQNVHALLKNGAVWWTINGGQSWKYLIGAGILPTTKPAAAPTGSLGAGPYGHSVAKMFAATYRELGLYVVGYPIDEPYILRNVLTQDFEHLRLQLRAGKVVVDALGREATLYYGCGMGTDRHDGYCARSYQVAPRPNTATSLYFPVTKHTLSGDLLRFWRSHGGLAVLGMPITEVYKASNGDGSNRQYDMQLFTNARLERHPETHSAKYSILLGLLGAEVLQDHGWLPGRPANPSF